MASTVAKKRALDFTNVKEPSLFSSPHLPEGEYHAVILGVTEETSGRGNDMWVFRVGLKGRKSATYPYRCTLNVEALWKVRNIFVAAGVDVPKKKVNVDPNKIVGREIGIVLEDDEYEGKIRSAIASVIPASELSEDNPISQKPISAGDNEDVEEEEVEEEIDVDDL